MPRIHDLGNGCGLLKGYKSSHANLHFKLGPHRVRRFYAMGYLSKNEYFYWLHFFGYSVKQIRFFYALDSLSPDTIMERTENYANIKT